MLQILQPRVRSEVSQYLVDTLSAGRDRAVNTFMGKQQGTAGTGGQTGVEQRLPQFVKIFQRDKFVECRNNNI